MATTNNPLPSKTSIKFITGTDEVSGKTLYTTMTLGDLRTIATDDDVRVICTSLASLIDYPLDSITRVNSGNLVAA
jgi:hypothetical protein